RSRRPLPWQPESGGAAPHHCPRSRRRRTKSAERRHPPIVQTPVLVQLDDLTAARAEQIKHLAFLVIRTSAGDDGTGNFQAWLAVEDGPEDKEAGKEFVRRPKKKTAPTVPPGAQR